MGALGLIVDGATIACELLRTPLYLEGSHTVFGPNQLFYDLAALGGAMGV